MRRFGQLRSVLERSAQDSLTRRATPEGGHLYLQAARPNGRGPLRYFSLCFSAAGRTAARKSTGNTGFTFGGARKFSSQQGKKQINHQNTNTAIYMGALVVLTLGGAYAAVPLYKMFCQAYGYGGTVAGGDEETKLSKLKNAELGREVTVFFEASKSFNMPWEFKPTQKAVRVRIGETALAFFTATNNSDKPVVGVATYNVTPMKVGQYFNKIQCFCFDEQRLQAGESIDMPVFFFLDPEMEKDRKLKSVENVVLSYTFFPASDWEEEGDDNEE